MKDDQLYLLDISIASSSLPHGLHLLGCLSDQMTEGAERENEKDTSDNSLLGVSQMMYFWEYVGPGATTRVPALSAKTERVREQTKGTWKALCEELRGDDATSHKPSEQVLDWRGTERECVYTWTESDEPVGERWA